MGHAYSRRVFLDTLSARARGFVNIYTQVTGIDGNLGIVVADLRQDFDQHKRGMTTMRRVKGRNTHEAMCPLFGAEVAKSIASADRNGHTFDTRFFARCEIEYFRFKTTSFRPTQIHPLEHCSPILRICSTRASVDSKQRIFGIIFAR